MYFYLLRSSTDTVQINSGTELDKNSKVDWAITTEDSIMDFRKGVIKFAEINGSTLVYNYSRDSIQVFQIMVELEKSLM